MNLVNYIFREAAREGLWGKTAIFDSGTETTYGELFARVQHYAGVLLERGICPLDRVAIVGYDCTGWVVAFLAAIAAGAIAVPLNTMMPEAELEFILNHCEARMAITSEEQTGKIEAIRSRVPSLEIVSVIDPLLGDNPAFASEHVEADRICDAADESVAFILYTSGSTGRPKGAIHLHRNLPYTVETCCKHVLRPTHDDLFFSTSKLYFAYGLGNSLSFPLSAGASAVLMRERPAPEAVAAVFRRHRPTIFFAVPAVYRGLIDYMRAGNELDAGSLRFSISAGEKLPAKMYHEWKELTGREVLDGIGSTEMLQMFMSNTSDAIKPGSTGKPIPGYEARIVDHAGTVIEGAGTGHLQIRGGSAFGGYWRDREKTRETISDGWVKTGDVYQRDEDGFYWFEGRCDDLFKVKGMWVSPLEVEDAILSHAAVVETAVVALPDADGMNEVIAYVVLRDGSDAEAATADILSHVRSRLAPYKRPSSIAVCDALPRTTTGKIQRFKLREALAT